MPIRFRCAYCNQLMGISTRKAGTVVRCPKCAGEIIVPVPEGGDGAQSAPEPAESPAPPGPPMSSGPLAFEDKNFEQVFEVPAPQGASAVAPTEIAPPAPLPDVVLPPPEAPPKRLGLFLPLPMLLISLFVIVLLLILMFVLGFIVGHATRGNGDGKTMLPGARSGPAYV